MLNFENKKHLLQIGCFQAMKVKLGIPSILPKIPIKIQKPISLPTVERHHQIGNI